MKNKFPLFIDVEASTSDEDGFPVAISWSLPDGQLKSVLIIPDDEWDPWEHTGHDIDIQHLFDQGVSGPDIISELNEDLDGQTVYIDGIDEDEALIEKLFDTYQQSLGFELAPATELFSKLSIEELLAQRQEIIREHQLDPESIEDKVRAFIFLANESFNLV